MFIGREKELTLLQQDYIGKAVMVYGKRRVGKTTLIQKALENCQHQTVYYECSKGAMQDNIDGPCTGIGPSQNAACSFELQHLARCVYLS